MDGFQEGTDGIGTTPQPTSAVNAGVDANKIGRSQKQKLSDADKAVRKAASQQRKAEKAMKKQLKRQMKAARQNQSQPAQSTLYGDIVQAEVKQKLKRPLWFWVVLGVLGAAIVGAAVWMIVMLLENNNEPSIELISNDTISDTVDNSTVTNYISQLQQIYDANNAESNADSPLSDSGANEVSKAVEKTLNTSQGSSQADLIRLAEMAVAYNNSDYEMAGDVLDKINPDKLGIKDQIYYYAIAETIYEENGNSEKAQEAFSRGGELIRQLCNIQECKQ